MGREARECSAGALLLWPLANRRLEIAFWRVVRRVMRRVAPKLTSVAGIVDSSRCGSMCLSARELANALAGSAFMSLGM
jgi:hypothetical protein